uniref:Protein MIS12 homolog n=1 Tax=Rhizophora mucronata TaxID=61149 RepID=A0A2P2Q5M7_RHIMU
MEGSSESEAAVFESLNLNPQIFINEALNSVDNLLDDAFHFFSQEASQLLKTEGTDRSQYLNEGISHIRHKIQSDLDTRLGMWEKYCLCHCFAVPKGFSLPKPDGRDELLDENLTQQDVLGDPDLDMQLDSLRDRLAVVERESRELNRELETLERESASSNHSAALSEILQLYEQNSANDMFQGNYSCF